MSIKWFLYKIALKYIGCGIYPDIHQIVRKGDYYD